MEASSTEEGKKSQQLKVSEILAGKQEKRTFLLVLEKLDRKCTLAESSDGFHKKDRKVQGSTNNFPIKTLYFYVALWLCVTGGTTRYRTLLMT